MYTSKTIKTRIISLLLCLALILPCLPAGILKAAAADQSLNIISNSKKADSSSINWKNYFGPDKLDTEFAGGVWTDKSVFTGVTEKLPGITLTNGNNFLIALSSIASNLSITGHTATPTDTMLVLDLSGSMVDDTYEVGTIRQGNNNYRTVDGIDMSLINAMIESTNATIDELMKQNANSRVGVVLYSGNTSTNQAATPGSATVVLPLDRYTGVDGEYLSVDTTWRTEALYARRGYTWQATGESATYVPEDTAVRVSVKDGLKTEAGANVSDISKQVTGGTYIQNGLYQAMNQFLAVEDTTVSAGPQTGVERMPVIVLMSDGAPTIATTDYNNIGNSNTGDGGSTDNRITFLTQLTAAYVRGRVAAKYQEHENDGKDILFLTLGLGTENSSDATNTLYPAGSNSTLVGYWNNYFNASVGSAATIISGNNGLRLTRDAAVASMNYVDRYFYASDAESLIDSFSDILSEIVLKAESYSTLVEGGNADLSGYVTFEDELGELMHIADMKGVLMSDGNGGVVLYTGKGIAESMTNGNLGSVENPTERGDELVRTVRERIPGITTTQAQQLIANAYSDRQLFYANNTNWSNYIGWYADENGNYVGFWDKDSGYENAPEGAVYANRSYGYLGINGDSDMMHVVVLVRTELATLHQTVYFKIPASLLPTVQYKVTLDENDPTVVASFEREDAIPMQLVYEVGLRADINSVNLNTKIAEHIARGGHIHRNSDGTVTFYTNEWAIGNDTNNNGIPDPEEVETAMVAESHFHPAMDNSRYYYTEDTLILDANGDPVKGSTRPSGTYFHHRYIYDQTKRITITMPISEDNLKNKAQYDQAADQWYIPAGTIFSEVSRFRVDKPENTTGTLPYSDFPAVFENGGKQDVYAFLGNNGSFTVAPAQGIALTKTVAEAHTDPNAPATFTFKVQLSAAVADPLITDTDGNILTGISSVNGNEITVTLTAGQTVVISGIPTGTSYTVTEEATSYYKATSGNASGTVAPYTVHAVDFVNTAKHYGNLIVGKDVNYPQGFVPGAAHAAKEFTIRVTFTGDTENMVVPQGATRNGNTYILNLRDGQSVTFANIPEGVTYTVTEDSLPNGYALNRIDYTDPAKKIDGQDTDVADVVNDYTLQPASSNVKIRGSKTLVTNDQSWNGETFTAELFQINNFADEEPVSTGLTAVMTQADPSYEIDLSSIRFDTAGTYHFHLVEQIPENRNENIAYDRTFGLFSITVGDADADGNLEIQAVNAYQNTTVTGNSQDGWTLEKNFTNVVTTDRFYLDIQKHVYSGGALLDQHMGDMTFGLFTSMDPQEAPAPDYYALTDTHGKATIMVPVTKDILQEQGVNGELIYYMREIAPALEHRVVGMNYDESWIYAISITWDEANNKAVAKYAKISGDEIGQYQPLTQGSFVFEHINTYEEVDVKLELSGNKTLNGGNDLGNREFSFSVYHSTAAFVKGALIETVENDGNRIAFSPISYTKPGIYYMVAFEEASSLGGITIDPTIYHITVEVETYTDTDGTTRLRFVEGYPMVVPFGTSAGVDADELDFDNTYTVTGSEDVVIEGLKTLSGKILNAGAFQVGLYSDAQCRNLLESASNLANGRFAFTKRTYTSEDLGQNNAAKTYTYYVKEIVPTNAVLNNETGRYELGGVSYDPTVHIVTVTVSHENGVLKVTPSENAATLQIRNTYAANGVDVVLRGSKVLSGDWSSVENKNFTFELFRANSEFAITDQTPVQTASVNGNADFSMTLRYRDGQEGIYYYVLQENISAKAGGVGYDAGEYHITVNVSDPGDGNLVAFVTMYRPSTGNTTTAVFTNTYAVAPTYITLEGTKSYVNSTTGASIDMTEGMFSFLVLEGADLENAALVSTGYNLADGTIVFTPIRYTAAGTHTYSVVELPGNAGGVNYDVDAIFTVTVRVVDNGDGTLTATAAYSDPVEFENTYTHQPAQLIFKGEKFLTGDWDAVPEANKSFTFELYETDSSFAVNGAPMGSVTGGAGEFTFDAKTYTTAGTYYYVIREKNGGSTIDDITYDAAQYQVKVTVTDNGEGQLIVTCYVNGQEADMNTFRFGFTNTRTVTPPEPPESTTPSEPPESTTPSEPPESTTPSEPPESITPPEPPKTGDTTELFVPFALMFISATALAVLLLCKKKEQRS